MNQVFNSSTKQVSIAVLLVLTFLTACSSSDSSSVNAQPSGTTGTAGSDSAGNDGTENTTGVITNGGTTSADGTNGGSGSTAGTSGSTESESALVSVTLDITVPVYVSNALQVQVQWGDKNLVANWVVDELWQVTDNSPANATNPLTITFSDDNGALTLASVSTEFETSSNPTQTFSVTADQFNSDQWDADNDGVSNLDESRNGTNPSVDQPPVPEDVELELLSDKTFQLSWRSNGEVDFFRVLRNPDGVTGYTQVGDDLDASARSFDHRVALFKSVNASYIVQACNSTMCVDSTEQFATGAFTQGIVYVKASNTRDISLFGSAVSLSADGSTLAVGADFESSISVGVNGNQNNGFASGAGAVYVFDRVDNAWAQTAYLKASNTSGGDVFGSALSLSANGDTLAVGALLEDSAATGINGNQNDNLASAAGAVYVFARDSGQWQQQAYLKASNNSANWQSLFGSAVSISADGNTLAVGARSESSATKGVNNPQLQDEVYWAGAVFVFERSDGQWQEEAYIKPSNTDWGDNFGWSVSLNGEGNVLAVGAVNEQSAATGSNGVDTDNSIVDGAGAVFVFELKNDGWSQQTYLKASNPGSSDQFGWSVSLSNDGRTLAVGAMGESSSAMGIDNIDAGNTAASAAGAVYVFEFVSESWQQQAYIKASNTDANDVFGRSVSLSADGNTMAVGASGERSADIGINGNQFDNSAENAGAAYVFVRDNGNWQQRSYIKASNTDGGTGFANGDNFGFHVALSADGNTLAVGAENEDGGGTGIPSDQINNLSHRAGAVYLY